MSISDAKKICPELVLVSGEDLSPFRSVSKRLYCLIRSYSWNQKVERLGLDEVFFDATDIVDFNLALLNRHDLAHSFFCLSRSEPEIGFTFDARAVAGPVWGSALREAIPEDTASMRLLVASHLAQHMRMAIEHEGYTSVCGISTNKTLSKLAGTKNKPRNQTTLVPVPNMGIQEFMDSHSLREVPGIGSRVQSILEKHVNVAGSPSPVTVRLARESASRMFCRCDPLPVSVLSIVSLADTSAS
jgi:DNA polymerase iota